MRAQKERSEEMKVSAHYVLWVLEVLGNRALERSGK